MKPFQSLSDSEMEIMREIWRSDPPVTSSQLQNSFAHKAWKAQTMSTFLTRLVDKGLLLAERRGKGNAYTPAVTEQEYHKREAQHVIDSMYHGSLLDFLTAFTGGKGLSADEARELKQWFEQEVDK